MAHDSQLPKENQENSNAMSRQRKTSQDVVLNWLRLYAAMPYMRGEHEITEEVILFYSDSLGQLQNPVALHRAFQWCRDHLKFLPQPPEILAAYGAEAEKMNEETKQRESGRVCADCRGTGWKMVPRPDALGREWAVACECKKRARV